MDIKRAALVKYKSTSKCIFSFKLVGKEIPECFHEFFTDGLMVLIGKA